MKKNVLKLKSLDTRFGSKIRPNLYSNLEQSFWENISIRLSLSSSLCSSFRSSLISSLKEKRGQP
jgi:hypothetical protein